MLMIFFIVGFLAVSASADFVIDDDDFPSNQNHHSKFDTPTFPKLPKFTFPKLPKFTFPDFSSFPTIPPIVFPKPRKGFNGVAVSASSSTGVDKDGKEYKRGGATIIKSENGVVKEYKYGDDPPDVVMSPDAIILPEVPLWPPGFKSPFMNMDAESLKSGKPVKNTHFASSATSAYSTYSNKNGVSHLEGTASVLRNVNGNIDEKTIHISDSNDNKQT